MWVARTKRMRIAKKKIQREKPAVRKHMRNKLKGKKSDCCGEFGPLFLLLTYVRIFSHGYCLQMEA